MDEGPKIYWWIHHVRYWFMRRNHPDIWSPSLQGEVEQYLSIHHKPKQPMCGTWFRLVPDGKSDKPDTVPAEPADIVSREELEKYIAENRSVSFGSMLIMLIDEKKEKDSTIYKRALVDRRLFSHIRCNKHYKPAWNTAVRLAFALRLDRSDFDALLKTAGYTLSNDYVSDLILAFCIERKIYDPFDIDSILEHFKQSPIFK